MPVVFTYLRATAHKAATSTLVEPDLDRHTAAYSANGVHRWTRD